jgi:hypothetical protein
MGWSADAARSSPVFEPLRVHGGAAFDKAEPDLGDFQELLDAREPAVRVAGGERLHIVPQGGRPRAFEDKYEARIQLKGGLQVRPGNLHDLFNVLAWLAFPRAKSALNARHFAALREQQAARAANRGPAQDALTLFDESGVIVVSSDPELLRMLREWRWKDLFWSNRQRLRDRACFLLFGHALYEKMLNPFAGITGRGMLFEVEEVLLAAPLEERLAAIDALAADHLSRPESLAGTRELAVVPVLGVPGWCADNERETYYDDTEYFRPGRAAVS